MEPAEIFSFGIPATNTPQLSADMRNQFKAVARNFYGTDPANPLGPQTGMMRILDENSGIGVKIQWYDGSSWLTILSGLENFAATNKITFPFVNMINFTFDHNLGTVPIVQILDSANILLNSGGGGGSNTENVTLVQYQTDVITGITVIWRVPPGLDSQSLQEVSFGVVVPGAGGDIEVQVTKDPIDGSPDSSLLTTVATIEAGDRNSKDAAVQPVVTGSGDEVLAEGDYLIFDVVTMGASTPPKGLHIGMTFSGGGGSGGSYSLTHVTQDRISVTFSIPTTGTLIIVG